MTIPNRIKELRLSRNVLAKDMAAMLGMQPRNFQRYETGEVDIPASKLIALAKFFNVSADYLLRLSDVPCAFSNDDARCPLAAGAEAVLEERRRAVQTLLARLPDADRINSVVSEMEEMLKKLQSKDGEQNLGKG